MRTRTKLLLQLRALRNAGGIATLTPGRTKVLTHFKKCIFSIQRRCIEWCCGRDSIIGQESPEIANCDKIRITEEEDASSTGGLDFAKAALAGRNDICKPKKKLRSIILSACPCTGGSPWQFINVKKPGMYLKIRKHVAKHKKIFSNCEKLTESMDEEDFIALEWPSSCAYWRNKETIAFMEKHKLSKQ